MFAGKILCFLQHRMSKTGENWFAGLPYSRKNKRGLILKERDFWTCLFSSHAYFKVS